MIFHGFQSKRKGKNMGQTQIIASYPCLGKTTLAKLNRTHLFERDFKEMRTTENMTIEDKITFFNACTQIIITQQRTNVYDYLLISDDERILSKLAEYSIKPILVFPNPYDSKYLEYYINTVKQRYGKESYEKIMSEKIANLTQRVGFYTKQGYDIRLTDTTKPYIENVLEMPNYIITPW